jgi:hypothetical protein
MSRDPILMLRATLSVLERERRHLTPEYGPALCEGRRRWRAFYGAHLSVDIRREWRGVESPVRRTCAVRRRASSPAK